MKSMGIKNGHSFPFRSMGCLLNTTDKFANGFDFYDINFTPWNEEEKIGIGL
jgi:hypothetical protein